MTEFPVAVKFIGAVPSWVNCLRYRNPAVRPVDPACMVIFAACVAVAVALPPQNWIPAALPDVFTNILPLNWLPALFQQGRIRSDPLSVNVTSLFQVSGFVFPSIK